MFESARLKLTLFYLAVIVVFSLFLTIGTRALAQRAFDNSSSVQQTGIRHLIRESIGIPLPDEGFATVRQQQDSVIARQLNEYVFYMNLIALVVGGGVSYWYAGRALKPIEEAHEAQARFAGDASHELRTPLTVMKTENEVFLRQKLINEDDARKLIASNLEEIQRLELLTSNLLSLANYEKGERLELKNVSTNSIAKMAVDQLSKLHPNSYKRVTIEVEDSKVFGNKESLAQALTLFLDNAIKYSPADKPIKLQGIVDEAYYKFMVDDEGPGIDPVDMEHIFDRLYRGDKNRTKTVPGHGLGLSLAKEIAKGNDVGLSVSNIKNAGARFTLTIKLIS
jgi:two-component system sensor histidine kinase CiaH